MWGTFVGVLLLLGLLAVAGLLAAWAGYSPIDHTQVAVASAPHAPRSADFFDEADEFVELVAARPPASRVRTCAQDDT